MTVTLHLGVVEIPYVNAAKHRRGKMPAARENVDTAAVAQILENKYGLLKTFYDRNEQAIVKIIELSYGKAAIDLIIQGKSMKMAPMMGANAAITALLKNWIATGGPAAAGVPGVPTKAALGGKSLRFKRGFRPGPRQSFIDTGLFVGSLMAWTTGTPSFKTSAPETNTSGPAPRAARTAEPRERGRAAAEAEARTAAAEARAAELMATVEGESAAAGVAESVLKGLL